jgi:hypothetical protein
MNACENYLYSISSVANSAVTALDSATGLIQLYTANSNTVGTHTATVTVELVSYPTVSQKFAFVITIEKCKVT